VRLIYRIVGFLLLEAAITGCQTNNAMKEEGGFVKVVVAIPISVALGGEQIKSGDMSSTSEKTQVVMANENTNDDQNPLLYFINQTKETVSICESSIPALTGITLSLEQIEQCGGPEKIEALIIELGLILKPYEKNDMLWLIEKGGN
jgi:hypothetical protein